MPLKILIIGAGVCGPAFATLLRRADPDMTAYDITVVERAAKLRETGLQIDLRAQGIPIVRKMGLMDAIRRRVVPERGVSFVDAQGRTFASFGKNDSGHGAQSMTSEYEIMRGDLVDVFYRASLGLDDEAQAPAVSGVVSSGNVRYEFGTTITDLSQHSDAGVSVTFSDGRTAVYDLVVGADGQSSRTRRAILPPDTAAADATFVSLGLFVAYFLAPRGPGDNGWMNVHNLPGGRGIFTRSAARPTHTDTKTNTETKTDTAAAAAAASTQVYMCVQTSRAADAYGVASAMGQPAGAQKRAFAAAFADSRASWRVGELIDTLEARALDDFYASEVGQVRCRTLVAGRVALLGDAGYCPSPITGMGTTLSLTGAYVLAGELARRGADDVPGALREYARVVRPFVDEAQKLVPGLPAILYPQSRLGVWLLTTLVSIVARLRIVDFLVRLLPENKGGLEIPEYPGLRLEG